MEVFEMVVMIVALSLLAGVVNNWIKNRSARMTADPERQLNNKRINELEQRIQVLERIVTDRKYDLKDQIDRLDT